MFGLEEVPLSKKLKSHDRRVVVFLDLKTKRGGVFFCGGDKNCLEEVAFLEMTGQLSSQGIEF